MIYGYPRLSPNDWYCARISGLGLGNLLFPWARSLVACRLKGWKMIAPQWWQYDVFAVWERNRRHRCYFGMLHQPKDAIRGFGRLFRLALLPHVQEPVWPDLAVPEMGGSKIVDFSGMGTYFAELLRYRDFVRAELLTMVRQAHLGRTDIDFRSSITVNVRLGDFTAPPVNCSSSPASYNQRTAIDWYSAAVQEIRGTFGAEWPAYIVSDGTDEELRALLNLENTHRLKVENLAGLLTLSRANVLVASGSTYSMWASFLGHMPVLWPPGQRRQSLYPECSDAEPEWAPGTRLSAGFVEAVVRHNVCGSGYALPERTTLASPTR